MGSFQDFSIRLGLHRVELRVLFGCRRKLFWLIKNNSYEITIRNTAYSTTGVPPFTLLMWGQKETHEQNLRKSILLSSTKREENRIEL